MGLHLRDARRGILVLRGMESAAAGYRQCACSTPMHGPGAYGHTGSAHAPPAWEHPRNIVVTATGVTTMGGGVWVIRVAAKLPITAERFTQVLMQERHRMIAALPISDAALPNNFLSAVPD